MALEIRDRGRVAFAAMVGAFGLAAVRPVRAEDASAGPPEAARGESATDGGVAQPVADAGIPSPAVVPYDQEPPGPDVAPSRPVPQRVRLPRQAEPRMAPPSPGIFHPPPGHRWYGRQLMVVDALALAVMIPAWWVEDVQFVGAGLAFGVIGTHAVDAFNDDRGFARPFNMFLLSGRLWIPALSWSAAHAFCEEGRRCHLVRGAAFFSGYVLIAALDAYVGAWAPAEPATRRRSQDRRFGFGLGARGGSPVAIASGHF